MQWVNLPMLKMFCKTKYIYIRHKYIIMKEHCHRMRNCCFNYAYVSKVNLYNSNSTNLFYLLCIVYNLKFTKYLSSLSLFFWDNYCLPAGTIEDQVVGSVELNEKINAAI